MSLTRLTTPVTPAHSQQVTNHYTITIPPHYPRQNDPHYYAFEAYRKAHVHEAVCYVGRRVGFDECKDAQNNTLAVQPGSGAGLELHHHFLELALINAVDLQALEVDFPDLTDPEKVKVWAETDANFMWLCAYHHRSRVGAHHASYADFLGGMYIQNLLGVG